MTRSLLLALVAIGLLALPAAGQVQPRDCNLEESQTVQQSQQGGFSIITLTGRFLFRCTDGTELRADYGTLNETTRELFLSGNVFYRDPERQMTSQQARYTSAIRRLLATGDVVFTDVVGGSVLRGPEVEYYRAMPGRPLAQVIATGRPHVTLVPRSEERADQEPLEVDADRVTILGEDEFSAIGRVEIARTDLTATANEARYDAQREFLELRGTAHVRGEQFQLSGDRIDALLPQGGIEHVHARRDAALVSEDLRVQAPDLQLFFARDSLQRMVGRGRTEEATEGRASAVARTFRLDADSLEALLPGQKLEQVIAIGAARGETRDTTTTAREGALPEPDTAAAVSLDGTVPTDRDWILGDTIIGYFSAVDTAAAPAAAPRPQDAREQVQLDRIVARGSARSLYRIRRNDAPEGPPALNYLAGDSIELTLAQGELEVASVEGLRRGVYLEPTPHPAPADAESTPEIPTQPQNPPVNRGRAGQGGRR